SACSLRSSPPQKARPRPVSTTQRKDLSASMSFNRSSSVARAARPSAFIGGLSSSSRATCAEGLLKWIALTLSPSLRPLGEPVGEALRRHVPRIGERRDVSRIDQRLAVRLDDQERWH